jgi:hypothetical protein
MREASYRPAVALEVFFEAICFLFRFSTPLCVLKIKTGYMPPGIRQDIQTPNP